MNHIVSFFFLGFVLAVLLVVPLKFIVSLKKVVKASWTNLD